MCNSHIVQSTWTCTHWDVTSCQLALSAVVNEASFKLRILLLVIVLLHVSFLLLLLFNCLLLSIIIVCLFVRLSPLYIHTWAFKQKFLVGDAPHITLLVLSTTDSSSRGRVNGHSKHRPWDNRHTYNMYITVWFKLTQVGWALGARVVGVYWNCQSLVD